ncbi:hypothetical protein MIMGU_mgv1a016972mg [Erythranthe guttata]|uniref:Uncharacterized protein n=1 Tax=Erythranthe guttata TaxID=4155 RepID=A0A022S1A5_ERYGU|nr:hypothetical protein MIMGU_mgv1a016972mg [Erythranthe guttata]
MGQVQDMVCKGKSQRAHSTHILIIILNQKISKHTCASLSLSSVLFSLFCFSFQQLHVLHFYSMGTLKGRKWLFSTFRLYSVSLRATPMLSRQTKHQMLD